MPKKFESWQFWAAAKKLLGETTLLAILGRRNGRTIRLYSADPKYTQRRCRDPLEHLHAILSELDTFGRGDVARLAIRYLQTAIDGDKDIPQTGQLLPDIHLELLADYQAVADLQAAIVNNAAPDQVAKLTIAATEEIDRTLARYCLDHGQNIET